MNARGLEGGDAGVEGLHQRIAHAGVFLAVELQHGRALIVREGEAIGDGVATPADGVCCGLCPVRVLGVGVVGEYGAGIRHARDQPGPARFVAMERALDAEFGKARVRVFASGWIGGCQIEDAELR